MGSLKEIALAAAFIYMVTPSGGTAEPACKVFQSYEHGFTANIRLVRSRKFPHFRNYGALKRLRAPHTLQAI